MLSDPGGDDKLVLAHFLRLLVQLPHNLLRLELLTLGTRSESEWILVLVGSASLDPRSTVVGFDLRKEFGHGGNDIAKNGDVGFNNLVDVLGLDLKVDDTACSVQSSSASSGCKGLSKSARVQLKGSDMETHCRPCR